MFLCGSLGLQICKCANSVGSIKRKKGTPKTEAWTVEPGLVALMVTGLSLDWLYSNWTSERFRYRAWARGRSGDCIHQPSTFRQVSLSTRQAPGQNLQQLVYIFHRKGFTRHWCSTRWFTLVAPHKVLYEELAVSCWQLSKLPPISWAGAPRCLLTVYNGIDTRARDERSKIDSVLLVSRV